MRYTGFFALALVLVGVSARADALEIFNPNTTAMDDIHLFFDIPPPKLRQDETGQNFAPVPGGPPFEVVSSGWSVDGAGGPDPSLGILGLQIVGMDQVAGRARLIDWCWSRMGSCLGPASLPWLKPTIKVSGKDMVLDDLGRVNLAVVAVPEPASWLLLLVGFGLAGAAARHRVIRVNAVA